MKNNIWKEKVFTGPSYCGAAALTLGLMFIAMKLFNITDLLYTMGGTFTVIGLIVYLYSRYKEKEKDIETSTQS